MSKTIRRVPTKHIKRSGAGMHTPKVKKPPKYKVDYLRGLGKDIWQGTDATAYVKELRDEWG